MNPLFQRSRGRRNGGFTLVEIMIAVLIIGLLATLSLPAFRRSRIAAQSNRFVSDLRTFSHAFENFSLQTGNWPAAAASGVVPTDMEEDIKVTVWRVPQNSVGGQWAWDRNDYGMAAGISVTGVTVPDQQMERIDARIDDGDLTTGLFRKVGSRFIYILQE